MALYMSVHLSINISVYLSIWLSLCLHLLLTYLSIITFTSNIYLRTRTYIPLQPNDILKSREEPNKEKIPPPPTLLPHHYICLPSALPFPLRRAQFLASPSFHSLLSNATPSFPLPSVFLHPSISPPPAEPLPLFSPSPRPRPSPSLAAQKPQRHSLAYSALYCLQATFTHSGTYDGERSVAEEPPTA